MKKFLLFIVFFISSNLFAQNWLYVDSVFNVSGVSVGNFSAPYFADLNNDGYLDLILGSIGDEAEFFWSNPQPFPTTFVKDNSVLENIYAGGIAGTNADYPTLVDLDGDGDLDLIIGGYNGLLYYENVGTIYSPQFEAGDTIFVDVNLLIGTDPKPAFVDIDDDGDFDLFVGIGESILGGPEAGITMGFRNTGTSTNPVFTLDNSLVTGISDIGLNAYPAFADIDGDGDYDLLFGRDLQTLVYYRNTGTKQSPVWTINATVFGGVESNTYWKQPALADIDKDGDIDLVYGTSNGILYTYRNTGTTTAPAFQYYPDYLKVIKINASGGTASLADFDGDGDNDLISGNWDGKFIYFINDGTPEVPVFKQVSAPFSNIKVGSYSTPVFVDIDNDGDYDIVSGAMDGKVYLYINNNGTFTQNTTMFGTIDIGWQSIPSFADLNGDGHLDLLVGAESGSQTKFYLNDGNNVFTENTTMFTGVTFPNYGRPTLADIDNDDDFDLIIGDNWGSIKFYRNNGTVSSPQWVREDSLFAGITVEQGTHPAFADLDGDFRKDMVIGEYNGNFHFYKNLFSPLTDVKDQFSELPLSFILNQNYPNPFNPVTTIRFQLTESGYTTLKVYDILGKEITVLVNEYKTAGSYQVYFDAKQLSSGTYFYTLQSSGQSITKRMMLIK